MIQPHLAGPCSGRPRLQWWLQGCVGHAPGPVQWSESDFLSAGLYLENCGECSLFLVLDKSRVESQTCYEDCSLVSEYSAPKPVKSFEDVVVSFFFFFEINFS